MTIYTHKWKAHDTIYIQNPAGSVKVCVWPGTEPVAYLYDLIVFPPYRGRGVGDKLLNEAIKQAKEAGCAVIVLWPECEPWVEDWYQRKGFAPNEFYKGFAGEIGWAKKI